MARWEKYFMKGNTLHINLDTIILLEVLQQSWAVFKEDAHAEAGNSIPKSWM